MKYLILFYSILSLLACQSETKPSQSSKKDTKLRIAKFYPITESGLDVPIEEIKTFDKTPCKQNIFCGNLYKFYYQKDYYVELYYRSKYAESISKSLQTTDTLTLFKNEVDDYSRIKLSESLSKQHLNTDGLDTLLVFNKQQNIVDTLIREHYEYLSDMIESSFIASYSSKQNYENHMVISSENYKKYYHKSAQVNTDSVYMKQLAKNNELYIENVYGFGYISNNQDTLAYLSFGNFTSEYLEKTYIFKNGQISDSISENYQITGLQAIPLRTNDNTHFYIAQFSIPETDNQWNSLISFNFETGKLEYYNYDRFCTEE